jgi:methylmalonyl-CoA epimerase
MIRYFDHIGIVVANLEDVLATYKNVYGLEPISIETYEEVEVTIAYIQLGAFQIHLLTPMKPGAGSFGKFLNGKGEGLHHIGLGVDNLERTVEALRLAQIPIKEGSLKVVREGLRVALIEPAFTQNVITELVERK